MRLLLALLAMPLAAQAFDHSHGAWSSLLRTHVVVMGEGRASQLRYAGMARDRALLNAYLAGLSAVTQKEFEGWTRAEQMAFLINAYNGFTVDKVLTRYPDLRSIWDFGRLFANPFKERFFTLLGSKASLDVIEHELLRKRYGDPRIHYAVNCASVGCPMLREEAYAAPRLEHQLEEQAQRFLSDRTRNRLRDGRLEVSRIFDWFKEDFGDRAAYFARYDGLLADGAQDRQLIAQKRAPLAFLDYDWTLNDSPSSFPR